MTTRAVHAQTQRCPYCRERISTGRRACPYCRSVLVRWYDTGAGRLGIALAAALGFWWFYSAAQDHAERKAEREMQYRDCQISQVDPIICDEVYGP